MSIVCKVCTFINVSLSKCQMCNTPFEKKDDFYMDPFTIMTTNRVGEINPLFVQWFEKEFDILMSVSVQTVHSIQYITKRTNPSIMIMLELLNHHFTLIVDGKKIDLGMYNTAPQNLPDCVKDAYFNFLKKYQMDKKKCGNCCLPMCIIVAVLLEKHRNEIFNFHIEIENQMSEDEKLAQHLETLDLKQHQIFKDANIAKKIAENDKKCSKRNRNRANRANSKLIKKLMEC